MTGMVGGCGLQALVMRLWLKIFVEYGVEGAIVWEKIHHPMGLLFHAYLYNTVPVVQKDRQVSTENNLSRLERLRRCIGIYSNSQ